MADVRLSDGTEIVAHVPNSGSMQGVKTQGSPCRVSLSKNPKRKLPFTLEMVKGDEGRWVGVNTSLTNKLVSEAFHNKLIPEWKKYDNIKAEVKTGDGTRLDFLLTNKSTQCYVEVKNVSMARPPLAVFPDAVTERGQKHLKELMKLKKQGAQAELFFVVQRGDCTSFSPCDDIDPEYGKLLRLAHKKGVKIRCYKCQLTPGGIKISEPLPIKL